MSTAESPALAEVLRHAAIAWKLFRSGRSLDRALTAATADFPARAAVQDVLYTAVRHLAVNERVVERLAARAPAADVAALLAVSLSQLQSSRHPAHTVVDQAVTAAQSAPPTRAVSGFVNALLRNFLRQHETLLAELQDDATVRYNLPAWWIARLQNEYPQDWSAIAESQQQLPPLIVRVNTKRLTAAEYLAQLTTLGIEAVQVGVQAYWIIKARPVAELPGFASGEVSVQDAGAQLAAPWLDVQPGMRVLDACAAPGGKTTHLAELGATDVTAVEVDRVRASRISENLQRCHLTARVVIGNAAHPESWIAASLVDAFDRILLDAPCTASGIVRRHPDIPWLRRPADVAQLATEQAKLLDALWPLLEVGGRLLYVVCSLFPEEGREQIARFGERHPEARRLDLPASQLLPASVADLATARAWQGSSLPMLHDGFFYALLEKTQ